MFKFMPLVVLVCLGAVHSHTLVKRNVITDKGSYLEVCDQEPMDLAIVLDSSRSIKAGDFVKTKKFLRDFLDYFVIGTGKKDVRVALIPFGYGIYPQHAFNLTTFANKADLLQAVLNIPHERGGRTDTGDALEYMHLAQMDPSVTRPYADKVAVVITDGNSQLRGRTKAMAENARNDGIVIYAVGIGNVLKQELLNIGGDDDHVTQVKSFDSLDSVKSVLASKTCIRREKPTTTPMPQTQTCGELSPADINFVFSPADMGLDGTSWTTSFISHVINSEDMDVGFQYGAVTGYCPDESGFALDEYDNINAIKERLMRYDSIKLPNLTERLARHGFSAANGARAGARKVAVVFADGGKGKKGMDIHRRVAALREQGVEVYVASPGGRGLGIPNTVDLYGTSSRQQAENFIAGLCEM